MSITALNKVSLQINLAPGDYPLVKHMLKHQLDVLSAQVNEILLIVETVPAKGRFSEGWSYQGELNRFITEEIQPCYPVQVIPVDYSKTEVSRVARYFFGRDHMPAKDFRGGPFYAYFFGLYMAANDLVFHLDADIFLGGQSPCWIGEAVQLFEADPQCFIVSPLPGPPHRQDALLGQTVISKTGPYTYLLKGMSTRLFVMDKDHFKTHKLSLSRPALRNQVKAMVQGNPNADLPEVLLSRYMIAHHLKRIDFLGRNKGLWSLHPPYRTASFYEKLPALINLIGTNNLPEGQLGFYDMIDEVCDWTEAKEQLKNNRWWKKLLK